MARLLVPFSPRIGGGGVVTFIGNRPGQAIFWELVSFDPMAPATEYPGRGYLKWQVTMTDKANLAINAYVAPLAAQTVRYDTGRIYDTGVIYDGDAGLAGNNDRLRVRADA